MDIDWSKLGFAYRDVNCHIRYTWRNGAWDAGELVKEPYLKIHVAATALHYGQDAFEGLRSIRRKTAKSRPSAPWRMHAASTEAPSAAAWPPFPKNCSWKPSAAS